MNIERIFTEKNNANFKNTLELILFDALDNYIKEKYNFLEINNTTSSNSRKEM